jgi:hypothetical protein
MTLWRFFLLIFVAMPAIAAVQPQSVFFTNAPAILNSWQERLKPIPEPTPPPVAEKDLVAAIPSEPAAQKRFGGYIQVNGADWAAWVGGEKVDNAKQKLASGTAKLNANKLKLDIGGKNNNLSVNQVFDPNTGEVIEAARLPQEKSQEKNDPSDRQPPSLSPQQIMTNPMRGATPTPVMPNSITPPAPPAAQGQQPPSNSYTNNLANIPDSIRQLLPGER